jgi:hypothetical protein
VKVPQPGHDRADQDRRTLDVDTGPSSVALPHRSSNPASHPQRLPTLDALVERGSRTICAGTGIAWICRRRPS